MPASKKISRVSFIKAWFCWVFVMMIGVSACSNQQVIVPKLTQKPTNLRLVGKFVWFDLFTQDLKSASRFYEGLFGWSFDPVEPGGKRVSTITREGIPIGNAIQISRKKDRVRNSRWLSYMSVENVDASVKLVEQNHGTVYMRPKELPDRGRVAVVKDPLGAVFAMITASGGDPPDGKTMENSWMGSELWTSNMDTAMDFYHLLVGYEKEWVDIGAESKYCLLVRDGRPRAGMVKIPGEDIKPNWVPYIAVEDVVTVAEKAKQLGGILLIEPDEKIREGMLAIISDPNGAVFAVQQVPDEASMGKKLQ